MTGGITAGLGNVVKPGSFCFIAGTKVLTDHGHKNIEDIEVGDLVLAYDEETGEIAYKPVVQLFRNTTKEWCTVSVRGNDGELYEITSTPGHKYFIPENRVRKDSRALEHASYAGLSEKWVSACDLKRGDKVLLSDGTLCEVEGVSCKKLSAPETTYNLKVSDFHTYYVSDACVLVHNAGTCSTPNNNPKEFTKLKHGQGWKDKGGNIWKKDQLHKDHWDISNPKGNKIKEVDFDGRQIWPNGPKNKNKLR